MNFLANLFWIPFGGLELSLGWAIVGLVWCISIVGIPVGVQCFKFAKLCLCPFGRVIVPGQRAGSLLLNILWIIFGGAELAITAAVIGMALMATVIGIPLGLQCFKFARLALTPFGARVR